MRLQNRPFAIDRFVCARRAVAARRHHITRREVAEVLLEQPLARRAEGLGRTTKQLGS